MSFKEEMAARTAECESIISEFLPREENFPFMERVIEAMNYSVLAGGKRLRPMFILETCRMYGGRLQLAAPFMAALEMIHTYSLVHDDLPAMDNDLYRRGMLTTHAKFGEGMAVLAGDGLLNLAYETAALAFDRAESPEETGAVIRALKVLGRNAGISGMVGGQCADLTAEKHPERTDRDTLLFIHRNKTSALIDSGFTIGAILAGAPEEDIKSLSRIAENIGIAFQIQDDILDVTGDSAVLGKQVGSDEKDGKVTWVTMFGLEKAAADVKELTEQALTLYDGLCASNGFLRELILSLVNRNS
ncbi:MAG: polyprenyl synthetase family protein [bacterium]